MTIIPFTAEPLSRLMIVVMALSWSWNAMPDWLGVVRTVMMVLGGLVVLAIMLIVAVAIISGVIGMLGKLGKRT